MNAVAAAAPGRGAQGAGPSAARAAEPPDPTILELCDAYEKHAERELYSTNARAMASLRSSLNAIRRIFRKIDPDLRASKCDGDIYQRYKAARRGEDPDINTVTLGHEADEVLLRLFTFRISSLGGFKLKQAARKSRLGVETLLFLDAVGICPADLKPPGGRAWRTWRWSDAGITALREFQQRGRPSGDGAITEYAAWYLEDRRNLDDQTLRRYRHALEAVCEICEIHSVRRKSQVTKKTIAEYSDKRQQRFRQQLKEAGKQPKDVQTKTLQMEKWLHKEIVLEGYSAADIVRLTGLDQNSLSQRKKKGQFVPELPFERYSEAQLQILYAVAKLYKGTEDPAKAGEFKSRGMPPNWFCKAVELLKQGHQPRYDSDTHKLIGKHGEVLYPPEPTRARGRELPADREQWTATELWEEYEKSPKFKGKPSPNRRDTFAATMTNHWLPALDGRLVGEIRADVVGVIGAAFERIAGKKDINSTQTLVTLRNNLQEVFATAGISLAEVPIPDVEPKEPPLTDQQHRKRLRHLYVIYQKLKELENVDGPQRKAAGLHALPGPWKDLVLLLFSPALRPLEAMPMAWEDLIQGDGGMEIDISKKQSLDDEKPEPAGHNWSRRIPAGRFAESVLQWRPRARHKLPQDPIFSNPRAAQPNPIGATTCCVLLSKMLENT